MPVNAGPDDADDLGEELAQVRLLINDTTDTPVFSDDEVTAFIALEGYVVKLAAAQALDTIADDEALTSKAIRTQDLSADGTKVADSLRKRATALRQQAADEDGFFALVDGGTPCVPELTEWPRTSYGYRGW